jgi:hypothetical protein
MIKQPEWTFWTCDITALLKPLFKDASSELPELSLKFDGGE